MQKTVKKILKPIFILFLAISVTVLSFVGFLGNNLPKDFNVIKGNKLTINSYFPINAVQTGNTTKEKYDVTLKFLGVIPVSNASVNVIDENTVKLLGTPFGIKIYTNGVMVVGITEVDTKNGNKKPAEEAGLLIGDLITKINNKEVLTNEEVALIIEQSEGEKLKIEIVRNNKNQTLYLTPEISLSSNKYKAGIWVRDSSAGIGTQTFFSPKYNCVAGLGHGICDVDTGKLLTINEGQAVDAEILSVQKGKKGSAGELKGRFLNSTIGDLLLNDETGIFYSFKNKNTDFNNLIKVALKQEVVAGDAKIYTTINGKEPHYYNCVIQKIRYNDSITKNMVIKITDSELLDKTGGIVQGMSGSPIIQNGKLIGAVTHVFLNDPTSGYGIFAENMLKDMSEINRKNNLKNAS